MKLWIEINFFRYSCIYIMQENAIYPPETKVRRDQTFYNGILFVEKVLQVVRGEFKNMGIIYTTSQSCFIIFLITQCSAVIHIKVFFTLLW